MNERFIKLANELLELAEELIKTGVEKLTEYQTLTIAQPGKSLREMIEDGKEWIFDFVKRHKEAIVEINKYKLLGSYRRKGYLGYPTVFLSLMHEMQEDYILTGSSIAKIVETEEGFKVF